MTTIEEIVKAEYNMILDLWKFERKWLEKIPLSFEDWDEMMVDANDLASKRKGESQEKLVAILNAFADQIEFIDKKMRGESK